MIEVTVSNEQQPDASVSACCGLPALLQRDRRSDEGSVLQLDTPLRRSRATLTRTREASCVGKAWACSSVRSHTRPLGSRSTTISRNTYFRIGVRPSPGVTSMKTPAGARSAGAWLQGLLFPPTGVPRRGLCASGGRHPSARRFGFMATASPFQGAARLSRTRVTRASRSQTCVGSLPILPRRAAKRIPPRPSAPGQCGPALVIE